MHRASTVSSNLSTDSPIALERRFVAKRELVCRRIGGETILVPISSRVGELDSIYTLSGVGSVVWTLLGTPVSIPEIAEMVCAEYDVPHEVAVNDIREFLDALIEKRLVVAAGQVER